MPATANKQVIFAKIPTGYPVPGEHVTVEESTIDLDASLPEGSFLLKLLDLSVDPYMRGRMRDASIKSYSPAFPLGKPMTGDTMNVVIKSNNPKYKEGDLVYGLTGCGVFSEYVVIPKEMEGYFEVRNEPKETGLPLSNYVGVLAMPGIAAYFLYFKIKELGHILERLFINHKPFLFFYV